MFSYSKLLKSNLEATKESVVLNRLKCNVVEPITRLNSNMSDPFGIISNRVSRNFRKYDATQTIYFNTMVESLKLLYAYKKTEVENTPFFKLVKSTKGEDFFDGLTSEASINSVIEIPRELFEYIDANDVLENENIELEDKLIFGQKICLLNLSKRLHSMLRIRDFDSLENKFFN